MELSPKNRDKILNLLLILIVIVVILGFITDIKNTLKYGGIDLRNRVVGARVLIEGMDPYFFQWHQGMSDRLLDPLVLPNSIVSRVTVPPTVLIFHATIAGFSYLQQKIIWLIVQWAAFLSTIFMFARRSDSPLKKNLILLLGWFFLNSLFWRVHVERGQIYIIYVFLLSLAWFFSQTEFKYHNILSGFFIGLTATLRPPIILISLPFLIYRKWAFLWGGIIGILSSLSFSLVLVKLSIWQSYFSAMSGMTSLINLRQDSFFTNNIDENNTLYPQTIEGMNNINSMIDLPHPRSSLIMIADSLNLNFISANILIISLFFIIILVSFFLLSLPRKNISINSIFLSGMVLYLIAEFFIPAPRDSYNDVQWILPLSLMIVEADTVKFLTNKSIILLLLSLLLSMGCFMWMPRFLGLSVGLMVLYVIWMSFIVIKQGATKKSYSNLTN